MLDLLIGSLSEIKSYVVVLSFFIKMMKQRTFQACSLKYSTKKGMFYVQDKLKFFKSGRGQSSPCSSAWLRAWYIFIYPWHTKCSKFIPKFKTEIFEYIYTNLSCIFWLNIFFNLDETLPHQTKYRALV